MIYEKFLHRAKLSGTAIMIIKNTYLIYLKFRFEPTALTIVNWGTMRILDQTDFMSTQIILYVQTYVCQHKSRNVK